MPILNRKSAYRVMFLGVCEMCIRDRHTVADVLALEEFDEDDLYAALDWLASQQERIERELYRAYVKEQGQPPVLVLYDVTSSYFEGECNELGQYGYNRDGKRGKRGKQQIVIGLLTCLLYTSRCV